MSRIRFQYEYHRKMVAAIVQSHLADDRDQEECRAMMRLHWQLLNGEPDVDEEHLTAAVRPEKRPAVEALFLAVRTSTSAVEAWIHHHGRLPVIFDRGYCAGWWREPPDDDGPPMREPPSPEGPDRAAGPRPGDEDLTRAEAEHDAGAYELGRVLELRGDLRGAAAMYRLAAEAGDAEALYALGRVYDAASVNIDPRVAEVWQHAADLGHVEAMYALAIAVGPYGRLPGRYLRQAAALGHAPAGYALGFTAFMEGEYDEAETWWLQAAGNGSQLAADALETMRADLRG